ncbi:MAG TPA: hypothetical protein VFB01_14660 [Burkholderiales bacterium]|nr:hypothetical protein [Burkholderiales bacterium]
MDKILIVVGSLMLAFSSFAVEPAKPVKISMATEAAQPQVKAAKAVKAQKAKAAKWVDEGDSRLNDYRLERESCCGPQ